MSHLGVSLIREVMVPTIVALIFIQMTEYSSFI